MSQLRSAPAGATTLASPRPDPRRGVFETLLVLDGRPVELDAHLARLAGSADAPAGLADMVLAAARGLRRGRLRVDVVPGEPEPAIRTAPVDDGVVLGGWERAATLAPFVVAGGLGGSKWADRRLLEAAERRAHPSVPLLLDADGSVLEASRANVVAVERGALVTPPSDGRILPGVTRARVLELARRAGLAVREEPVELDRLLAADEVLLTGSVRGVEPVRAVGGAREWAPGDLTPRLAAELGRWWTR